MKTKFFLPLLLLLLALTVKADELQVVTSPVDGCFAIAGSTVSDKAIILYDDQDAEVVQTVIECLISDLKAVTKKSFMKYKEEPSSLKNPIIVGTIGQSSHIDQLIADGKIDVTDVVGKWEAFGLQVIDNPMEGVERALVIFGSQPRATAYGMFHLSRMMGVSPWIWWADVTPTVRTRLYVTPGRYISGTPSVKFRGIFLNDEDWALRPWAAKKMDTNLNNFGPKTYGAIMELLLRLRANTLWPAMHAGSRAFWFEKNNIPLIMKYDIYMGSSHCEQMLRDNEYEWGKTGDKFGGHGNDDWVWSTNKEMIKKYWAVRVGESRGKNAIYTLGMRGVHDTGINGYKTTEERVAALTEIIAYQRQLLADSIGDPTTIPQIFIPYKEVLTCYNAGLKVPEDVTLMWVDDNHGYIRQMPTQAEQARSGGNAIYYHLSYLGTPDSYLWLSTISPSLCSFELCKAYDQGIRDQWIINVGDIKPAEEELEFCMDLAWDINSWTPDRAYLYSRDWAARTFGEAYADEISQIKSAYYRLGIASKPEHVHLCHFDHSNAEIDARIAEYQNLYNKVIALRSRIPASLRDAYYELIEYPVCGCTDQNIKLLRARQSFIYAWAGQGEKALDYAQKAQKAFNEIKTLTDKYNTDIAGGKWEGMMNYKPSNYGHQLEMPAVATSSDVAKQQSSILEPDIYVIAGGCYDNASASVKVLHGLGIGGSSATVWPLDMKTYKSANAAPYAEYTLPVQKGLNVIQVRLLPTFPINTSYDLRTGISINRRAASVISIKVSAMTDAWDETVPQGYIPASVHFTSTESGTVKVRVSFMDPGLCVSALASIPFSAGTEDLTNLLTNPDFEYGNEGSLNAQGSLTRGVPKGWRATGDMNGNSWGINQDAKHIYGINVYWASAKPMPNIYELSQTIPASKLGAGTYLVTCVLGTQKDKMGNCRLFANKNVQYYGKESDYLKSMLTSGETNTFAGYGPSSSGKMTLNPMSVMVTLADGESLKLGIRTSNYKSDGTRSTNDSHGWFKVDHFRLQRIDAEETPSGILPPPSPLGGETGASLYDLQGRYIGAEANSLLREGIYILRHPNGSIKKVATK